MVSKTFLAMFLVLVFGTAQAGADVIYLVNGDKITAQVVDKNDEVIKVNSSIFGEITISLKMVDKVLIDVQEADMKKAEIKEENMAEEASAAAAEPVVSAKYKSWKTKVAAGYTVSNGNTKNSHAIASVDAKYKKEGSNNEWAIKGQYDYGSDKGKMNVQKLFAKAQSDTRLGELKKWFNSRSVEVSHDRFSNIDYRVLPAIGMGYWFREGDPSKFELDLGLGYEYTNYRDSTKPTVNMTLIPHGYFDKVLIGKLKFAQGLTLYPSMKDIADLRFRSESSLVNPISDALSWKLSIVDEYNSSPQGGAKKSDVTVMSGIEYSF